jgi:predicted helicase
MTFESYIKEIQSNLARGNATEHTHRPALKTLIETLQPGLVATNEPRRIKAGAPDYILTRGNIPLGYVEAKDVGENLSKVERSEQLKRYRKALPNLVLTDYLEFRWYVDGERRMEARVAEDRNGKLRADHDGIREVERLLRAFLLQVTPTVGTPKELAERMAAIAREIHGLICRTFEQEGERGQLHTQLEAFRKTLIPELAPDQFADMYAQTIAYGLFAARTMDPEGDFSRMAAGYHLPRTNPFLRRLFNEIAGPDLDDRVAWLVDDLVNLLRHAKMDAILENFGRRTRQEDPVVHFYETFLTAYDPKERERRGVYYTPEPVVSYIVRSVDNVLRRHFGRSLGLADPNTLVLDPATGTATFLYHVIRLIHERLQAQGQSGAWSNYVRDNLLPRIFGFELLMAPYTVAHMKLGVLLRELGYDFGSDERLRVYLTNTLEKGVHSKETIGFAEYITQEADAATKVKEEELIEVIIGNPPYSGISANKGQWITDLIDDYKWVDGQPLGERRHWLQDDYVKFIRFGQWRIEKTGRGVLAFVTNHGYLDNPTFRGMRQSLMHTFTDIYLLDLHGSSRREQQAPEEIQDKNVFDIQQGVAIGIFIKEPGKTAPARVHHADLWGQHEDKYAWLSEKDIRLTDWSELTPSPSTYMWVPEEVGLLAEYEQGWRVPDFMAVNSTAIQTSRDHFVVDFDRERLISRIATLSDDNRTDSELRERYRLKDGRNWTLDRARSRIRASGARSSDTRLMLYRPFDTRFVYYVDELVNWPRHQVMDNMDRANLALLVPRQLSGNEFRHVFCSNGLSEMCVVSTATKEQNYHFPLYLYPRDGEQYRRHDVIEAATKAIREATLHGKIKPKEMKARIDRVTVLAKKHFPEELPHWPNLAPEFVEVVSDQLGLRFIPDDRGDLVETFGPEDMFNYAYTIFHSPTYRERYAEFLKRDFPRLPLTSDRALFAALVERGAELVSLHLMTSPTLDNLITRFPESGDNIVEKVRYDEATGRVYINKDQYFEGVSPDVWKFRVGGYPVLDKWLKDRKGRKLSFEDIMHYQRIVVALSKTRRIMQEIDALIPEWPLC